MTKIKYVILVSILFSTYSLIGQTINGTKVDTSNYYTFYSYGQNLKGKKITTSWLSLADIAPVIKEELATSGYEWLTNFALFKVDSGQYLVLACYSQKSNFGFYYHEGHNMMVDKKDRYNNSYSRNNIGTSEHNASGKPNFMQIKKLPDNIFVLSENLYWYQYTENSIDDKQLITKQIALELFRKDVRAYISKAPKATK